MELTRRHVIAALGALAAAPGMAQGGAALEDDISPSMLLSDYEAKLALHSFDAVAPLIADDAVFWFNDGSFKGIAAIRGAFEKTFRTFPVERYWLEQVEWLALDDAAACCVYRFRWTYQGHTGGGRGTTAMRKTAGRWQIVHEHLSQEPKAA